MFSKIKRLIQHPSRLPKILRYHFSDARQREQANAKWLQESQIGLISFPKSGITWLRTMVGYAIQANYPSVESDLWFYNHHQTQQAGLPLVYVAHQYAYRRQSYEAVMQHMQQFRAKKIILMVRDIRDTMVSYYHYRVDRRQGFEGDMATFLRSEHYGMPAATLFYRAWHEGQPLFKDLLLVRYEALHLAPQTTLATMLAFIGVPPLEEAVLQAAVDYASFGNMQQMEQAGTLNKHHRDLAPEAATGDKAFVRQGKFHAYHNDLNADHLAYIDQQITEGQAPREWMYFEG